jgi:hypothetical protein
MTALSQGGPQWLIFLALFSSTSVGILAAVVRLAKATIPQQSKDRLEWWKDRRDRRERKKCSKCRCGSEKGSASSERS